MKYCSQCAGKVRLRAQDGLPFPRYVCDACRAVFYRSPRLVAACLARWEDRFLLCRRGTEPGYGLWALPAGFVESGETAKQGAQRELLEEASAEVEIVRLCAIFNLPFINQTQLVFEARLLEEACKAGPETLEARLFDESEIPWPEMAFVSTVETLRYFLRARGNGSREVFYADIVQF